MMANPHALVEGCILTSYAIRANHAFIYVRGEVPHVHRRLRAAVREAYAAGYLGTNILGSGFDLDLDRARRRGRVHLRRGDRAAGLAGGPSRAAAAQAAVPRGRRPVRLADGGQQRRDDRQHPLHRGNGADWLTPVGHREVARASSSWRSPATCDRPGRLRGRRWAPRCASCSSTPAACATAASRSSGCPVAPACRCSPPSTSTCR